MYSNLYTHNGKLILFDDCDSVFDDDDAVNVLKGALDSSEVREISWQSARPVKNAKGEIIPQKFEFTGRVIFISNLPQKDIDPALKSRSFVLEVALSPEDTIEYIEGILSKIMPDQSMSVKKTALNLLKAVAAKNENVQINVRTLLKVIKILLYVSDLTTVKRMITQVSSYK